MTILHMMKTAYPKKTEIEALFLIVIERLGDSKQKKIISKCKKNGTKKKINLRQQEQNMPTGRRLLTASNLLLNLYIMVQDSKIHIRNSAKRRVLNGTLK